MYIDRSYPYTVSQAASMLGVSTRTVRRRIADGSAKATRRVLDGRLAIMGGELIRLRNGHY